MSRTWVVRFDAPAWEKDDIDVMFKEYHFETEEKARAFKEYMERDVGVASDAIETFRQIMMGVSSNSKESYDYYKNAPKNELADHLLEMWCEDQDDFDRPTLGSSYNSYVEMMDASRKSKKAESFNSCRIGSVREL